MTERNDNERSEIWSVLARVVFLAAGLLPFALALTEPSAWQ